MSLSALMPGLGHLYCGHLQRGIMWIGLSVGLMVAAMGTLMAFPSRGGFLTAITLLGVDGVVWLASIIQAYRLARAQSAAYTLREYNRWYVYLTLLFTCGFSSAVGLAFVVSERAMQAFVIPSESMAPTIQPGDRILTLKEVFLDRNPKRGELVVFRNPENRRQLWIKRVIALAGDSIEWRANGELRINGQLAEHAPSPDGIHHTETIDDASYSIRLESSTGQPSSAGSLVVPPHQCFVLGDNRSNSRDSRHFGPIAYSSLIAQPVMKVWGGFEPIR